MRRPLIAFTPKSLLRLKAAVSQLDDFTDGHVPPVIGDSTVDPASVRRVLLCSGKVYYDLAGGARRAGAHAMSRSLRVEQLYPLPAEAIRAELARYPDAEIVWVQEEPANQGAWPFMALNLPEHLGGRPLLRVSRRAAASPAVGSTQRPRGAAARGGRHRVQLTSAGAHRVQDHRTAEAERCGLAWS